MSSLAVVAHYQPPDDARCAASLLLVRDALSEDGRSTLEVLMLRRAEREGDLRSGAAVFPGGVVDANDRLAHAHCLGPDDATASRWLGLQQGGLDYLVAAVRETFEEVGLLLVDSPPDPAALTPWRDRLNRGEASISTFCVEHGLRLDLQGLSYFSHWLTPPGLPQRFDTRFFIAQAPAGQLAQADLGEAVELMWLSPQAALDPDRGLKLLPVTQQTLRELAAHDSADQALAAARERAQSPHAIRLTMPRRAISAGADPRAFRVVLPHELPYAEIGRLDPEGRGHVHSDLMAGRVVHLSERVMRLTAPNPGPMTGPGTNTYLVRAPAQASDASSEWTVIDPGPHSQPHLQALLAAVAPGRIGRILVTHTHRDHSPGAVALTEATGAPVWGWVAQHPQWQDPDFAPHYQPQDDERIAIGPGCTLRVLHTPGHASNHLCYLLEEEALLFTGDHVMQGSTVVINPPDGDMSAYLVSLNELLTVDLQWLAPGHGFLVGEPHQCLRALIAHRLRREAKVHQAVLDAPGLALDDLVKHVYDDVPASLHGVAERSLLAHLLKLQTDQRVEQRQQAWWALGD